MYMKVIIVSALLLVFIKCPNKLCNKKCKILTILQIQVKNKEHKYYLYCLVYKEA